MFLNCKCDNMKQYSIIHHIQVCYYETHIIYLILSQQFNRSPCSHSHYPHISLSAPTYPLNIHEKSFHLQNCPVAFDHIPKSNAINNYPAPIWVRYLPLPHSPHFLPLFLNIPFIHTDLLSVPDPRYTMAQSLHSMRFLITSHWFERSSLVIFHTVTNPDCTVYVSCIFLVLTATQYPMFITAFTLFISSVSTYG